MSAPSARPTASQAVSSPGISEVPPRGIDAVSPRSGSDASPRGIGDVPVCDGPSSCTIVIPVLNQLAYTRQCVDSLLAGGTPASDLLVIDNGSTDDTPAWLISRPDIPAIRNRVNLGCGGAWAQGAFVGDSDWVVLLNNDVIACDHAMARLFAAADRHGLDVVSPGLIEGPLDYDFAATAEAFTAAMAGHVRRGWFHGVCFAVRRRVFEAIGFPDTDRQLGGREDVEFLVRCLRHGVPVGTVGDALLHHFGSITQKAIKQETSQKDLGDRDHFYAKVGMNWWARKAFKRERRAMARRWAAEERAQRGFVMHMQRTDGAFVDVDYL